MSSPPPSAPRPPPPPPTPTTTTSSAATADPHPGDQGADGVLETQEHHGGGNLDKSGTITAVTAVTASTVTIKTATGTTTYTVTAASDIDKNGEAAVSTLASGDAVTFSVDPTSTTVIDNLHTGNEAQNLPQAGTGTAAG